MKSLKKLLTENKMSLIVSLPSNNMDAAKAAIHGGADAVKVHINVDHRASGNKFGSLEDNVRFFQQLAQEFAGPIGIVPGGSLEQVQENELKELEDIGFNYYSIYLKHMPSFMLDLHMEKTVAGDSNIHLETIKALNSSSIDAFEASIIEGQEYGTSLNYNDLLNYQSIASTLDMPVIVPSQRKLQPDDVPHLANAGIKAIMIGAVVTGDEVESIERATSEFKKAIEQLR